MKKNIFFLFVLIVGAGLLLAYYEYNRKPVSLLDVQPVFSISATALAAQYENDENLANSIYLGKVVDVSGKLVSAEKIADSLLNIVLGDASALHNVSCMAAVEEQQEFQKLKVGDRITIRGVCTGFLADVELNRGVLITSKNK